MKLTMRFFLSRFDMAVNGGGSVSLQFQRSPLKASARTVHVPWNGIVVLNPVIMTTTSYGGDEEAGSGGGLEGAAASASEDGLQQDPPDKVGESPTKNPDWRSFSVCVYH